MLLHFIAHILTYVFTYTYICVYIYLHMCLHILTINAYILRIYIYVCVCSIFIVAPAGYEKIHVCKLITTTTTSSDRYHYKCTQTPENISQQLHTNVTANASRCKNKCMNQQMHAKVTRKQNICSYKCNHMST